MRKNEVREYVRDKRSPIPKSEAVSRVMSANRARDTKPEQLLREALRDLGATGYRKNWRSVPGRPDIAFVGKKIAIFVHGCFWHRCPTCNLPLPKTNTDFWKAKFERNVKRDSDKRARLEALGWAVYEIWECDLLKDTIGVARRIGSKIIR